MIRARRTNDWFLRAPTIVAVLLSMAIAGCSESPVASQEQLRDEALVASQEQLRDEALSGDSVERQVEATHQLAEHGPVAVEPLREVLREGADDKVRAAAAEGLGKAMDVDSFPLLLDALEDDSLEVRRAADHAIEAIAGRDYFYEADDPPEKRAQAILAIREFWQAAQQSGSKFIEYRRHPEKLEQAKREAARKYGAR